MRAVLALAFGAALASPASAQTEIRVSPITVEADVQLPAPGAAPTVRIYPQHAEQQHIEGDVVLRCQIRAQGRFDDCEVLEETPKGEDFGRYAGQVAARFQFPVPGADGKPLDSGVVLIPLRFRMPHPAPETAPR